MIIKNDINIYIYFISTMEHPFYQKRNIFGVAGMVFDLFLLFVKNDTIKVILCKISNELWTFIKNFFLLIDYLIYRSHIRGLTKSTRIVLYNLKFNNYSMYYWIWEWCFQQNKSFTDKNFLCMKTHETRIRE